MLSSRPSTRCVASRLQTRRLPSAPDLRAEHSARLHRPHRTNRRVVVRMASSASDTLLALDFDGVLCDSCGESSLSGWKATVKLWPEVFKLATDAQRDAIMEDMRVVRPVVETGYENMLLVRALYEKLFTPDELLASWGTTHLELMERWGLERAMMVELFGLTRDEWIKTDYDGWLAPNVFYPGVVDATQAALASPSCDTYIVTTKQARFTSALMDRMAGGFPKERIFSTTVSGQPKTDILRMLQSNCDNGGEGMSLVFVEDKLSTLQKVLTVPDLDAWQLYLVDWGYNTEEERAWAAAHERIQLIDLKQFVALVLK